MEEAKIIELRFLNLEREKLDLERHVCDIENAYSEQKTENTNLKTSNFSLQKQLHETEKKMILSQQTSQRNEEIARGLQATIEDLKEKLDKIKALPPQVTADKYLEVLKENESLKLQMQEIEMEKNLLASKVDEKEKDLQLEKEKNILLTKIRSKEPTNFFNPLPQQQPSQPNSAHTHSSIPTCQNYQNDNNLGSSVSVSSSFGLQSTIFNNPNKATDFEKSQQATYKTYFKEMKKEELEKQFFKKKHDQVSSEKQILVDKMRESQARFEELLEDLKDLQRKEVDNEKKFDKMKLEFSTAKEINSVLEEKLNKYKRKFKRLKIEHTGVMKSKENENQTQLDKDKIDHIKKSSMLEVLTEKLKEMEKKIESKNKKLKSFHTVIAKMEGAGEKYKEAIANLTKDNENLKSMVSQLNKYIDEVEEMKQMLTIEVEKRNEEIKKRNKFIQTFFQPQFQNFMESRSPDIQSQTQEKLQKRP